MRRIRIVFILAAGIAIAAFPNGNKEAQPDVNSPSSKPGLGLGIVLGEPTGFNVKLFLHPLAAFDAGFAWSFANSRDSEYHFAVYADYLFHFFGLVNIPVGDLGFYCGAGGLADIRSDGVLVSIRIPLGATYMFAKVPLDVFLEIVPAMEIFPQTTVRGFGGIGIRYWFK